MKTIELDGHRAMVHTEGSGGPLIVFPTASFGHDPLEDVVTKLNRMLDPGTPYTILALVSDSWDDDYSPWPMTTGGRRFGGHGSETLRWILEVLLPYARGSIENNGRVYVAGYSLAGLFALWCFHESDVFDGVACCSGSLWFEGWDEYAEGRGVKPGSLVYLSLGGKEPGSGPQPVCTIGDCYRIQKERFASKPGVSMKFEMNPGGHFSDPDGRVAKGIAFLLRG